MDQQIQGNMGLVVTPDGGRSLDFSKPLELS